jgi:hypothetical protein
MVLRITSVIALMVLGLFLPGAASAEPAATPKTVLILGSSVSGGASSKEALAVPAGFDIEIATDTEWLDKTEADFASYHAIILGDANCAETFDPISAAIANVDVWSAAVDGQVLVVGTDPVFHSPYQTGAAQMVNSTVSSVVLGTTPGKTSALVVLSCYYNNRGSGNVVDVLSGFGVFVVRDNPCHAQCHITEPGHPAMSGLTDNSISYWDCPMHANFTSWPEGWDVLAMGLGLGAEFVDAEGDAGTPYILYRTEPNIVEEPCEETPSISFGDVTPDTLWSPNKKMIDITVEGIVTGDGMEVTRTITCSETPKAPWTVYYEDGADIWHFKLRADRNGAADPDIHSPRIYTITYTGTDDCGTVVQATTYVIVPHDQKGKKK